MSFMSFHIQNIITKTLNYIRLTTKINVPSIMSRREKWWVVIERQGRKGGGGLGEREPKTEREARGGGLHC